MRAEQAALLRHVADLLGGRPSPAFVGYSLCPPLPPGARSAGVLYVFTYVRPAGQTGLATDTRALQTSICTLVDEFEREISRIDHLLTEKSCPLTLVGLHRRFLPWDAPFRTAVDAIEACTRMQQIPSKDWWYRQLSSLLISGNLDRLVEGYHWAELPPLDPAHRPAHKVAIAIPATINEREARYWDFVKRTQQALQRATLLSAPRALAARELPERGGPLLQALLRMPIFSLLVTETLSTIEDQRIVGCIEEDVTSVEVVVQRGLDALYASTGRLTALHLALAASPRSVPEKRRAVLGYTFKEVDDQEAARREAQRRTGQAQELVAALRQLAACDPRSKAVTPVANIFESQTLLQLAQAVQNSFCSDESASPAAPPSPVPEAQRRDLFSPHRVLEERALLQPLRDFHASLRARAWRVMHEQFRLREHLRAVMQTLWLGDAEVLGAVRDVIAQHAVSTGITYSAALVEQTLAQSVTARLRHLVPQQGLRLATVSPPLMLSSGGGDALQMPTSTEARVLLPALRLSLELHYDWPLSSFFPGAVLRALRDAFLPLARLLIAHWAAGQWWRDIVCRSALYMSRNNYRHEEVMTEELRLLRACKRSCMHLLVTFQAQVSALLGVHFRHVHHKMGEAFFSLHARLEREPDLRALQRELERLVESVRAFTASTSEDVEAAVALGMRAYDEVADAASLERAGRATSEVLVRYRVAEIAWQEARSAGGRAVQRLRGLARIGRDDPYAFTTDELWQLDQL